MTLAPIQGFTPRGNEPVVGIRLQGKAEPAMAPLRWAAWVGLDRAPVQPEPAQPARRVDLPGLAELARAMQANAKAMTEAHELFLRSQRQRQDQLEAAAARLMEVAERVGR